MANLRNQNIFVSEGTFGVRSSRMPWPGVGKGDFRLVFPRGPSQETWPFIGRDPHLPIFGGLPALQASSKAMIDSFVRHS